MHGLVDAFERWAADGRRAMLARVVGVEAAGTATRVGAALAVNDAGEVAGSLDEPGAEAAVVPAALARLGHTSDDGGARLVGTFGGGPVLLATADWSVLLPLVSALRRGRDVALAVQVQGPALGAAMLVGGHGRLAGSLGDDRLDLVAASDTLGALALRRTTTLHYGRRGARRGHEVAIFVESFNRPPRLVLLGASGLTAALAVVGSAAGFRALVCDPRPAFATADRYPAASAVACEPLDAYLRSMVQLGPADAVCVLTTDPDQEVAAITTALGSRAGFVGAFGTGHSPVARREALRRAGVDDGPLVVMSQLDGPAGAGAAPAGATAVAVCAEIVSGRGRRLAAPPPPSFR